jgi:hypothetical protein
MATLLRRQEQKLVARSYVHLNVTLSRDVTDVLSCPNWQLSCVRYNSARKMWLPHLVQGHKGQAFAFVSLQRHYCLILTLLRRTSSPPFCVLPKTQLPMSNGLPTFAGQCHRSVPPRLPTHITHVARDISLETTVTRFVSCCILYRKIRHLFTRSLAPFRPSLVTHVAYMYITPSLSPPLASSATPVTNSQLCSWNHVGPITVCIAMHISVSFKRLTRSQSRFPLSYPTCQTTPVSGSEDTNSHPPPPVHSCAHSRLGSAARFHL